jgi:hypothetical protein
LLASPIEPSTRASPNLLSETLGCPFGKPSFFAELSEQPDIKTIKNSSKRLASLFIICFLKVLVVLYFDRQQELQLQESYL